MVGPHRGQKKTGGVHFASCPLGHWCIPTESRGCRYTQSTRCDCSAHPLPPSTPQTFPACPARPSKRSCQPSQRGLARSLLTPAPRPCTPCGSCCNSTGSSSATTTAPGSACSGDSRRRSRTRSCPPRRARWTAAAPRVGGALKDNPCLRFCNSRSSSHQTSHEPTAEDPGR